MPDLMGNLGLAREPAGGARPRAGRGRRGARAARSGRAGQPRARGAGRTAIGAMGIFPLPLVPEGGLASSVITTVWVGVFVLCFFNLRFGWVLSGLAIGRAHV